MISEKILGRRAGGVFLFIGLGWLLFFTTMRGSAGSDTENYRNIFNQPDAYRGLLEPGFSYVNEIFNFLGLGFTTFLFFFAFLSLAFYTKALRLFVGREAILFSLLIIYVDLYLYFNFSGMRQGLALAVAMVAGYYAYTRNAVKFFLLLIVAVSFHKSAIIISLYWPIFRIGIHRLLNVKIFLFIGLLILAWIYFAKNYLFELGLLLDFRGAGMYFSEAYNEFGGKEFLIGVMRRLIPILFFVLVFFRAVSDDLTSKVFVAYFFGFMGFVLSYPFLPDFSVRMSSYFIIFESVLWVKIISLMGRPINKLLSLVAVGLFSMFKVYSYSNLAEYSYPFALGYF